MSCVETVESLIEYINAYISPPPKQIPDIKQLCYVLQDATQSYLQLDIEYYNNNDNDSQLIESVVAAKQESVETKDSAENEQEEDEQAKLKKRLEGYKQKSLMSLKKHSDFKRQISSNMINTKTDIFFKIALFTYSPNQSCYDNYYNSLKYYSTKIYQLSDDKVLKLIMDFLPTSMSFHDNSEQITFECDNGLIKFDQSTDDFLNIRSKECILPDIDNGEFEDILINCYVISKGDEMWLGLVDKNTFDPKKSLERNENVLLYYGGRQRLIGTTKAFGYWDSGYGAIHAFGNVETKDIRYYQHGHWISFIISNHGIVKIYNDNECVYQSDKLPFGKDGMYFMCTVDDEIDSIFIERAISHVM